MSNNRLSNFELLRIIAMLMVVVGHTQFVALGRPTAEAVIQNCPDLSIRCMVQYLCSPCVNIFVLISGYFGIRASVHGASKFYSLFIILSIFSYLLLLCCGLANISIMGMVTCLGITSSFWFVKSYLLLYILAPILNSFVEKANKELYRHVLIGFFAFQTIFGWYLSTAHFIETGMSTISFIGLYLLGRYITVHKPKICNWAQASYLVLFLLMTLIQFALAIGFPYIIPTKYYSIYSDVVMPMSYYSSPIVIIQAIALLLFFSKFSFHNKHINEFATCCFSMYILHQHSDFIPIWKSFISTLHSSYSMPTFYGYILLITITYGIFCYIVHKVCILFWKHLNQKFTNAYSFFNN